MFNVRRDPILDLPELRSFAADLAAPQRMRAAWVLTRPFLCAAAFGFVARAQLWPLAPVVVFALFVSIVTSAHDVVHGSLGLSRRQTHWALFALGALVLESGHAYRATHLRHHAVFPMEDDPEGEPAHHSAWRAVLAGPTFLLRLWWWAMKRAARRHDPVAEAWLLAEAAWAVGAVALALALFSTSVWPAVYVAMVIGGSWVYPLLTSHLPHRHFGDTPLTQTHTLRGRIIPALFLELTYHLEHHLYPAVPTHRLPELSRRLTPYFDRAGVEPWRVP